MTIDQLIEFSESDFIEKTNRQKIALLLEAINDWPVQVETKEAFFINVRNFLMIDTLTYQLIKSRMEGLDPMNFPWQLEALTSLLQIADQKKRKH